MEIEKIKTRERSHYLVMTFIESFDVFNYSHPESWANRERNRRIAKNLLNRKL